uniref:Glucosylceramidase n=1 Tax=Pyramimonas obovata TaxID=1411642 RepID=A0A7S0RV58_9CHLO|mmetsp:Transcript_7267/g.14796  ORF Transcript_7267/g.14796 Transcript_7267/m.14796 type:complete len:569 (+) Transcript_7267:3-1709(+)
MSQRVQNEPEFAAPWEACKYTASYMRDFVKHHLGPTMRADHPDLKIMAFDHNKDHVHLWANVMYEDPEAAQYVDGLAVHWYTGDYFDRLEQAHATAPEKFLLASEATDCPGIADEPLNWHRAEALAHDILGDLASWVVAWTDWNLLLDPEGGPNHLGNNCDALMVADPENTLGQGPLMFQPTYYFMGHFSRFVPPGATHVAANATFTAPEANVPAEAVSNGALLALFPCDDGERQQWGQTFSAAGNPGERDHSSLHLQSAAADKCMDIVDGATIDGTLLQVWKCYPGSDNQNFGVDIIPGTDKVQLSVGATGFTKCADTSLHNVVKNNRMQIMPCDGRLSQQWVRRGDAFESAEHPGMCLTAGGKAVFDKAAFKHPVEGGGEAVTLVLLNRGDQPVTFSVYDEHSRRQVTGLSAPPHSMQTLQYLAPPQSQCNSGGAQRAEMETVGRVFLILLGVVVVVTALLVALYIRNKKYRRSQLLGGYAGALAQTDELQGRGIQLAMGGDELQFVLEEEEDEDEEGGVYRGAINPTFEEGGLGGGGHESFAKLEYPDEEAQPALGRGAAAEGSN